MKKNKKSVPSQFYGLIKSELGRKLLKSPPKSLSKLSPEIRKLIASQLGYKNNRNN